MEIQHYKKCFDTDWIALNKRSDIERILQQCSTTIPKSNRFGPEGRVTNPREKLCNEEQTFYLDHTVIFACNCMLSPCDSSNEAKNEMTWPYPRWHSPTPDGSWTVDSNSAWEVHFPRVGNCFQALCQHFRHSKSDHLNLNLAAQHKNSRLRSAKLHAHAHYCTTRWLGARRMTYWALRSYRKWTLICTTSYNWNPNPSIVNFKFWKIRGQWTKCIISLIGCGMDSSEKLGLSISRATSGDVITTGLPTPSQNYQFLLLLRSLGMCSATAGDLSGPPPPPRLPSSVSFVRGRCFNSGSVAGIMSSGFSRYRESKGVRIRIGKTRRGGKDEI